MKLPPYLHKSETVIVKRKRFIVMPGLTGKQIWLGIGFDDGGRNGEHLTRSQVKAVIKRLNAYLAVK